MTKKSETIPWNKCKQIRTGELFPKGKPIHLIKAKTYQNHLEDLEKTGYRDI